MPCYWIFKLREREGSKRIHIPQPPCGKKRAKSMRVPQHHVEASFHRKLSDQSLRSGLRALIIHKKTAAKRQESGSKMGKVVDLPLVARLTLSRKHPNESSEFLALHDSLSPICHPRPCHGCAHLLYRQASASCLCGEMPFAPVSKQYNLQLKTIEVTMELRAFWTVTCLGSLGPSWTQVKIIKFSKWIGLL